MRLTIAALAGALLFSCIPAWAADPSVDDALSLIRTWTVVKQKNGTTYYISPEDTRDNAPDKMFHTAEIFDEPYEDKEFGVPPNWGYVTTRSYNCDAQTATVKESTTLYLAGLYSHKENMEPVSRSEIRADEGIKYFAHACGD